jgi:acetyltransferase-like isoleucine patch superfamily enzyme
MADVGHYCSIGPGAIVGLAQHPTQDFVSTHPKFYLEYPGVHPSFVSRDCFEGHVRTTVGNDVWIGAHAMIKGGVSIGDGAVIGAGAVVTRDAEPYGIYAGVPARLIRFRFDEETVRILLQFRWWDRGDEWIAAHAEDFHDADAFVAKVCREAARETAAAAVGGR